MPLTLAALNSGDAPSFVAALGHLFEHSPWVAEGTFPKRPFRDADGLLAALCETMYQAPVERQLALVRAHPDLAGRLAKAGALTEASSREQAAAGLDRLNEAEGAEITRLNAAYTEKFGFPFVICARLTAKDAILTAMRIRLGNTPDGELSTALAEIAKIARLRLNDALAKPS
ncbi:MAG TPA: 2-oxo-4-hydroxy-4-carboxy-5-ureidoimidazoline decarboxylase [Opitutaceae bacterium]|jgi:2-oxo-4-hydroxy-4-carboxy-5-ureidoimidazoline decarboxylase